MGSVSTIHGNLNCIIYDATCQKGYRPKSAKMACAKCSSTFAKSAPFKRSDIPKRNHQSDASKIVKTIKYLPLRHESNSHFPLNLCKKCASSHKKLAETLGTYLVS